MKKIWREKVLIWMQHTFLTSGVSIFLLAGFAYFAGGSCIFVHTVFENILANACIHIGLFLTGKFESRYFLVNAAIDVAVVSAIIFSFGLWFEWFSSVPPVILLLMVFLTYIACSIFRICRTQADIKFINERLQNREQQDKKENK